MVRACSFIVLSQAAIATPSTMKAVVVRGASQEGSFGNVKVVEDHPVPVPGPGEVLIKVMASSINPADAGMVTGWSYGPDRVPGFDAAGLVEQLWPGCGRLRVGDAVWADLGNGATWADEARLGAWAQYAVANESQVGLKPHGWSYEEAASMPLVGLTDYQAMKMTGAAWTNRSNMTVVVTSGAGGTGTVAIELARAFGATRVVTAASSANSALMKRLGATEVVDYHKTSIWEVVPDDSVDLVFDNHGASGTADLAMSSLKSDGYFVSLVGSASAKHPKPGVTQINYGPCDGTHHEDLDSLLAFVHAGQLSAVVQESYSLDDIVEALRASQAGHVVGKLAITVPHSSEAVLV